MDQCLIFCSVLLTETMFSERKLEINNNGLQKIRQNNDQQCNFSDTGEVLDTTKKEKKRKKIKT